MGKQSSPVVGYRYYMTLLLGIGRGPIDELFQIVAGGQVAWDGPLTDTSYGVTIERPDLFGGDSGEGGIVGYFNLYMGKPDQPIPSAFVAIKGSGLTPAMRGVTTLMYDGMVCSGNPYPKEFKFRVRRAIKGWDRDDPWYPERAVIKLTDPTIGTFTSSPYSDYSNTSSDSNTGTKYTYTAVDGTKTTVIRYDSGSASSTTYSPDTGTQTATSVPAWYNDIYAMNPAHIIYECCTNRDWGRGMDPALIDNISFTSAANALFTEKFGMCIKWSRQDDVDAFVQTIIDHIGAVLYTDKTTGLLCLRLIRADYAVNSLPVFDYTHGLLSVETVDSATQDNTPNEIIVKYNSPVLNADAQARAQNIASINALGCVFSMTKEYSGLPTSTLAQQVAQRDLRALGSGMKRIVVKLDRRGYLIVPGEVIIVNAPDRKLNNAILRVAQVEDTSLTDGAITLTTTQDVFGLPLTPFVNQEPSAWLAPNRYPVAITEYFVIEATHRDLEKLLPGGTVTDSLSDAAYVVGARAPTSLSMNFQFWTVQVAPHTTKDYSQLAANVPFIECGTLKTDIGVYDTVLRVTGLNIEKLTIGMAMLIRLPILWYNVPYKEEYVALRAATLDPVTGDVILTVGRGCVDTPAVPHLAGARVWLYDDLTEANALAPVPKNIGLFYRMLDHTLSGTYPLHDAREGVVVTPYYYPRHALPYPGADFRLGGAPRDNTPPTGPELVFTWKHRDRTQQLDKLIDESAANIGPEANVAYYIFIEDLNPRGLWGAGGGIFGFYSDGSFTYWFGATPGKSVTTNDHLTFTAAQMAAWGVRSGPKRARMITFVPAGAPGSLYSLPRYVEGRPIYFYYLATDGETVPLPVAPPTSGWGVNFGSNFGAP